MTTIDPNSEIAAIIRQARGGAGVNEADLALSWATTDRQHKLDEVILALKQERERQDLQAKRVANMVKAGQRGQERFDKIESKTQADIQRAREKYRQEQLKKKQQAAEAAAKAKAKQPSPNQVLDSILKGSETKKINPVHPMSGAPADGGGAGTSAAVQSAVQGGRFAQEAGPLSAASGPGAPAPSPTPTAQGAGGPMSLNVGGRTFQAPATIQRQVSELGAQPMKTPTGYMVAPTFSTKTITEPNVLTAGDVLRGTIEQQRSEADMTLRLTQMTANPGLSSQAARAYHSGDMETWSGMLGELSGPLLAAQQADLNYKRALTTESTERAVRNRIEGFVSLYGRVPTSYDELLASTGGEDGGPALLTVPEILQLAGAERFTNQARNLTPDQLMDQIQKLYESFRGRQRGSLARSGQVNAINMLNALASMDQVAFVQPKTHIGPRSWATDVPERLVWQLKDILRVYDLATMRLAEDADPEIRKIREANREILVESGGWVRGPEGSFTINPENPYSAHSAQIVANLHARIQDDWRAAVRRNEKSGMSPAEAAVAANAEVGLTDVLGFRKRRTQEGIQAAQEKQMLRFRQYMGGGGPDIGVGRERLQEFESQPFFQRP